MASPVVPSFANAPCASFVALDAVVSFIMNDEKDLAATSGGVLRSKKAAPKAAICCPVIPAMRPIPPALFEKFKRSGARAFMLLERWFMESPRRITCSCVIPKMERNPAIASPASMAAMSNATPMYAASLVKSRSSFFAMPACAAAAIMLPSPSTATGMFFDMSTSPADISLYCDAVKLATLLTSAMTDSNCTAARIGPPNILDSKIAPDAIMPTPFSNCTAPAVKALVISSELVFSP